MTKTAAICGPHSASRAAAGLCRAPAAPRASCLAFAPGMHGRSACKDDLQPDQPPCREQRKRQLHILKFSLSPKIDNMQSIKHFYFQYIEFY
ncbi:MAG: hypothetical protein HY342_07300 [Candidatus Lambdaproteobacteria bacterium]|nr:hypothetical protein [Candidatus Lambdaproteobacteria bacterium]